MEIHILLYAKFHDVMWRDVITMTLSIQKYKGRYAEKTSRQYSSSITDQTRQVEMYQGTVMYYTLTNINKMMIAIANCASMRQRMCSTKHTT